MPDFGNNGDMDNRTEYSYDPTLHATVIPSGKSAESGGGSLAFDAQNPNIKQNIVVCEDNNMKTIAVMDKDQMTKAANPNAADVEQAYLSAAGKAVAPIPQTASIPAKSIETVRVTISGPFGKVKQRYSSVFRDGNQLVLMANNNELSSSYELPDIDGAAIPLTVLVGDKALTCIWAGLQFTLPDDSVTFTVLLVVEEQDNG